MFGMNPVVLYAFAFLVFTNLATATGWWVASNTAEQQQRRAIVAEEKLVIFAEQVRAQGEKAERRTAELIATAKTISMQKDADYAKNLDRLRADYQRLRQQYASQRAAGGGVSALPEAPRSVDAIPADALPLAAECAETTLTLESLQSWVKEQEQADGS